MSSFVSISVGDKPFMCKFCNLAFSNGHQFEIHIVTHIDEKPLECTQCNKSFSNPDTLKVHMLRHTGEKT